jgi:hypothetical protein
MVGANMAQPLSMVSSDTGNGPNTHKARAYRERIEEEAKAMQIGPTAQVGTEQAWNSMAIGREHLKAP